MVYRINFRRQRKSGLLSSRPQGDVATELKHRDVARPLAKCPHLTWAKPYLVCLTALCLWAFTSVRADVKQQDCSVSSSEATQKPFVSTKVEGISMIPKQESNL